MPRLSRQLRCSLTQLRESLYRSGICNTWGFDMDDVKAVIEQATDAMSTPPEAPAEVPKPAVKKVRRAAKKVARKVGPTKRAAAKKAKTSVKKSAKKAPKKAKAKTKKAKRGGQTTFRLFEGEHRQETLSRSAPCRSTTTSS